MSKVAIIGASDKPERYACKAQEMLMSAGYAVVPVSRGAPAPILGVASVAKLEEVAEPIDTVTLYVGPAHLDGVLPGILAAKPRRVIFNPGTESDTHETKLTAAGILASAPARWCCSAPASSDCDLCAGW